MTCQVKDCDRQTDGNRKICSKCRFIMNKFGITTPERDRMLVEQNNKCAICETEIAFVGAGGVSNTKAVIDHCHQTNVVRGILCSACNLGLGAFRDSKKSLINATAYLEECDAVQVR